MKSTAVILLFLLFLLYGNGTVEAANISYKIEMPNWKDVNHILPKYTKFTVLDIETGKKFKVQRRAGSNHADVQPLTAKDTSIMKKIYGGKWSWKRRAIIVIHKDQWIAASMHGMPHGAGALQNNFPGHFCIHFYGSTTHRTNLMDLSHKLMILKAAGRLDEYLAKANPYDVIYAYFTAFKQQDERIVSKVSLQKVNWRTIIPQMENVNLSRLEYLPPEDLTEEVSLDVPIDVEWYNQTGRHLFHGDIHLIRFSPQEAWKVDSLHFLKENYLIK
ncbi:hypothetical protein [Neobacillus mesonae]|uniref:hypothetical protein n=1 Tax=Neobacillus mesonae TaxID=1193713 RepID=UPI0020415732|nr:hypothetical protein [Neobacillus mesonae]MCM3568834.1 hypothetical protein [Neobacillus mesonae]